MRNVAVFLLAGVGLVAAGDSDVVFRSDVSLVRVDAQVVDRDNRAITGLRAADFVLREEGQPQKITNFGTEAMPVDVLLLLDVSASMRPHVQRIASAAHDAMRALGDDDRIGIMLFDRSTRVRLPFRSSRDGVDREFESLLQQETFNGGTDITRALEDAAHYIARQARPGARRAIVILTDDQTELNRDVKGVERELTKADAVLSALIAPDAMAGRYGGYPGGGGRRGGGSWPGGGWPGGGGGWPSGGGGWPGGRRWPGGGGGPGMRGPHTQSAGTEEIARSSGGDSMPVGDASALENTLARIRQRYSLNFHLPQGVKPSEERNIDVALADTAQQRYPGAQVHYRRVYIAPGPGSDTAIANNEPPVVTTDSGQSRPRLSRRPAVNEPGSSDGGWRQVDQNAPHPSQSPAADTKPASTDSKPADTTADSAPHGWRKVKPGDQQ